MPSPKPSTLASSLISPPSSRCQAVWLSASGDLVHDAQRDLRDVGALSYQVGCSGGVSIFAGL
jgi:hypothetical protein